MYGRDESMFEFYHTLMETHNIYKILTNEYNKVKEIISISLIPLHPIQPTQGVIYLCC